MCCTGLWNAATTCAVLAEAMLLPDPACTVQWVLNYAMLLPAYELLLRCAVRFKGGLA